jgi:hypothetical protein
MTAKKPSEAFAMNDEDEFFETSSNEGGSEDGNNQDGNTEKEESRTDGNLDERGESGTDKSDDSEDLGKTEEDSTGKAGKEGKGEERSDSDSGTGENNQEGKDTEDSNKSKAGTEKQEGDQSSEGSKEQDFFADLSDESNEGDQGSNKPAVSFKNLGSKLQIELDKDTEEEFTDKVNQKIKAAQQQVDLTGFDPEARKLVKHLNENGGKIGDFFVNPKITKLQSVLTLSAEEKVKIVRRSELAKGGSTKEEIEKEIEEELSSMPAQKIVNLANDIDNNAKKLIAEEIEEIVGQSEQRKNQEDQQKAEKAKQKKESLKNLVQKKDNFLGLSLSEKARQTITRDIDTGKFDQIVDLSDDEILFAAYMIKRQGPKIAEAFSKQLADKSREGYNKAIDKTTSKLHNRKDSVQSTRTGHEESSKGKKNFDSWGSMDI